MPGVGAPEGATAAELSQRRFGGPTRIQSTSVTLTTTFGQILAANPRRVFVEFINRGTVDAAVDSDGAGSFASSILIAAGGGYVSLAVDEDGESTAWPYYGATTAGTAVVRIIEIIRV